MPKRKQDDTLSRIEEAQTALRESIETTKKLADESARLVEKHRAEIAKAKPPNPA
jgi:hypothetical protein